MLYMLLWRGNWLAIDYTSEKEKTPTENFQSAPTKMKFDENKIPSPSAAADPEWCQHIPVPC